MKEKTADGLFEELGYKKEDEKEITLKYKGSIVYRHKRNPFKEVIFLIDKKEVEINSINLLTLKRLQAINKKCQELGWIE